MAIGAVLYGRFWRMSQRASTSGFTRRRLRASAASLGGIKAAGFAQARPRASPVSRKRVAEKLARSRS